MHSSLPIRDWISLELFLFARLVHAPHKSVEEDDTELFSKGVIRQVSRSG